MRWRMVATMSEAATLDPFAAVIEQLTPRQKANDKIDRQHWLRTRLTGITATEAKVLHTGSTRDKADVVRKKIEGDDFRGNKFTDWGSYREDFLLEQAAAKPYGWLVCAEGNERHLATPDGLRLTWGGFAVVECKTSKYFIGLGSDRFNDYGYLWQILWQMYCAGTDEAFYVWEQHDDDWSRWDQRPRDDQSRWHEFGPQPIAGGVEHIVLTPELKIELDKMIKAADRALGRLDKKVAELREQMAAAPEVAEASAAEDAEAPVSAEHERLALAAIETQAKLYRRALNGEKALGEEKSLALAGLLELSVKRWGAESNNYEFAPNPDEPGKLYNVSYSPAGEKPGSVADEDAARKSNPELWEQLEKARVAFEAVRDQWQAHAASHTKTVTKGYGASVRVTEKKGKTE